MLKRFVVVFACLVFAFILTTSAQEPASTVQQPDPARNDYPNFDLRDSSAAAAANASLVAQRTAVISAFTAEPEETAARTRISVGRFGLPKIYQRDGNTLTAPSVGKAEDVARVFLRARSNIYFLSAAEV